MRHLYFASGLLAFGLGVLGAFLPLLPTTPFMLLSVYCFSKSSPRWHAWLINHPVWGEYIQNYMEHRVIPLHVKVLALVTVWISIPLSALAVYDHGPWLSFLVLTMGAGASFFLLTHKSAPPCPAGEKAAANRR